MADSPASSAPAVVAPLANYPELNDPVSRELQATMIAEVRSLYNDLAAPSRMDRQIAEMQRQIDTIMQEAQAKLDALDARMATLQNRRANIRTLYIEASERLDELNGKLKRQQNSGAIAKLLAMKQEIAQMEAAGVDVSILFDGSAEQPATPESSTAANEAA